MQKNRTCRLVYTDLRLNRQLLEILYTDRSVAAVQTQCLYSTRLQTLPLQRRQAEKRARQTRRNTSTIRSFESSYGSS